MAYQRKTADEYELQGCYAHGWECLTTEDSRAEARARLRDYRENGERSAMRIVHMRVPLTV